MAAPAYDSLRACDWQVYWSRKQTSGGGSVIRNSTVDSHRLSGSLANRALSTYCRTERVLIVQCTLVLAGVMCMRRCLAGCLHLRPEILP